MSIGTFREWLIESETSKEIINKWYYNDPDVKYWDYWQALIKDVGRDTIRKYNDDIFTAIQHTKDERFLRGLLKDIKDMNNNKIVKY